MKRDFYLDLARAGLRMPIGADLILHRHPDAAEIVLDGRRLGAVIEETAREFHTPLAVALMDLRLEKADVLRLLGVPESQVDSFHFDQAPADDDLERVRGAAEDDFAAPNRAHIESVRHVAEGGRFVPVGMAIGPFSLMTKLLKDPITPVAMAGTGLTAADDPGVHLAERCLALAGLAVQRSVKAQIRAGAKAMLICEPAANVMFVSPKQVQAGSDILERFVMAPHLRLNALLRAAGVDLVFHDCGKLSTFMVREFAGRLHPVILSLGSSRRLWEDAAVVPKDVVLFGNLPTKNFYSDAVVPLEKVEELTLDLTARMRQAGHPHILGSECDVLDVPDAAETIWSKVRVMLTCGRGPA